MHGTYVQANLSQKKWTGLAGGVREGQNRPEYGFWLIPLKIQGLDKTNPLMETRRNKLNPKGPARNP